MALSFFLNFRSLLSVFLYFYLLGEGRGGAVRSDLYPLERRGDRRPRRLIWSGWFHPQLSSPDTKLTRLTTSCGQPAGFTYVSEGGAKENAPSPSPGQQEVRLCFIRIMSHKMQIKVFKNPYFTTFLIHFIFRSSSASTDFQTWNGSLTGWSQVANRSQTPEDVKAISVSMTGASS